MITIDINNQQLLFLFFIIFLLLNIYLFIIYKKDKNMKLINKDDISISDDILDYLIDREINYYMTITNMSIEMVTNGIKSVGQDKFDELRIFVVNEVLKYTTPEIYDKIRITYNIYNKKDYIYIIEKRVFVKIYGLLLKQSLSIK